MHALAQRFLLARILRRIPAAQPVARAIQRVGIDPLIVRRSCLQTMKARPAPVFRAAHQPGPQRVALDVPADGEVVDVGLHGKGLVAALIQVPHADAAPIFEPEADVRERESLHERRQVAVVFRPEHQVLVIGHQAIRAHPHGPDSERLLDDAFRSVVIAVVVEEAQATDAAVEDVIDDVPERLSRGSGHACNLTQELRPVNRTCPVFSAHHVGG